MRLVGEIEAEWLTKLAPATRLATLEEVLRYGLLAAAPWDVAAVVVQDEYTHDVVVDVGLPAFLVFDTT